jgi:hypothetical protein
MYIVPFIIMIVIFSVIHVPYTGVPPVSAGNTFQDLPRLHETMDNTEPYI